MAHAENLSQLYAHLGRIYGRTGFAELRALANVHIEAALASVLKVAAIGLAFDPLFSEKTIDTATIPHAMAKAWNLAFPNRPIESLNQRSTESVQIVIHGWKSKLFASEVTRRLNKGEWIGLLQLEPGQCVEPFTPNPRHRWRLRITAPGPIQLPAIDLINRIYSTLKRYPEQSMIEFGRHPGNASPTPLAATDDHSVSTLPSVVIPDLLGETAHILARNRSDLATTPLFDTLADELAQCLPRLNADQREKKNKPGQHETAIPSVLITMDIAKTLRAHYPHPDSPNETPDIVRQSPPEPLAGLTENTSRTSPPIDIGALKNWIIQTITGQPLAIPESDLKQHLNQLQKIKTERLIHKAFRQNEWLDRILTGYSPLDLQAMLDDQLQQTRFLLEKIPNTSGRQSSTPSAATGATAPPENRKATPRSGLKF